jgi:hypothetical protein
VAIISGKLDSRHARRPGISASLKKNFRWFYSRFSLNQPKPPLILNIAAIPFERTAGAAAGQPLA